MFSSAWIFDRLIETAVVSLVLCTLGSLAVLCCRQPVRRMRIIILTLAGSVLAPFINLLPGLPHWSLPGISSITAHPIDHNGKELRAWVAAPVQLADLRSTSEPLVTAADAVAHQGDPTGQTDPAVEDQDQSPEPLRADSLLKKGDRHLAAASFPQSFDWCSEPVPVFQQAAEVVSDPATDFGPASAAAFPQKPASTQTVIASMPHSIDLASWIVGSYLVGVAALAMWWVLGFAGLRRMLRTARPAPACCRALLREIAGPAGENVRLLVSSRAPQPFTFGWFQPVIVLPEEMTNVLELNPEPQPSSFPLELRWSLAHEWSHIARGDVRVWSFAGLVRLVYYYQPLCWWLRRELRLCQDYLADAAAAHESSPENYAEFLAARGVGSPLAVGLGIAGGKSDLYRRIAMLVQNRRSLETHCPRWWTVAAATGAVALVVLAATFGSRTEALAAASQPADSSARQSSETGNLRPLDSGESKDPGGKLQAHLDLLAFRDPPDTAGQDTTVAEPEKQTDKSTLVDTVKGDFDAVAKQRLLDGIFARATAIKTGRFETTVSPSRYGELGATRRRFVVSGENWSRAIVSNRANLDNGSGTQELEINRAAHHFSLTSLPGVPLTAPAPTTQPARLTINWPKSVSNTDDLRLSPPIQAGTIWHRATVPYLRDHSVDAHVRGASRVNDCETQIVEWTIPADDAQAAFVNANNLLSGGGIYRVYACEKLGFSLARIEYVDRFGTPQYVFDFSEFRELAPGIHYPKTVHIQAAGESWRMDIKEAEHVNESIDDREFILKIPSRTYVEDIRSHRGDRHSTKSGLFYDKRKYPLRNFTTGAEYPDGLPAAMLAEMDRDAVSPEEFRATQTRASTEQASQPAKPKAEAPRVTTSEKIAEKTTVEKAVAEKTGASAKAVQNLPDKEQLLYNGKNFQVWRELLLTDLDPDSRMKALQALRELGANGYADEAAAAIAEILKTEAVSEIDWFVYDCACSALARLGASGMPILASQLRSSERKARLGALNALVGLAAKNDAAVPPLIKAIGDDDADIRAKACAALAEKFLDASGVLEALIAVLNNDEKTVRTELLVAIGRSKPHTVGELELLKVGLRDEDDETRGLAACLFAKRAPSSPEHAALLRQVLLSSPSHCVGSFVSHLTSGVTVRGRQIAEMVVPSLIAIIEASDLDRSVGLRAVELSLHVLRGLAREQAALPAIPVLVKGVRGELSADSQDVRVSFAETLGHFGPAAAEALPALKEFLKSDLFGWTDSTGEVKAEQALAVIKSAIRRIEGTEK